MYLASCLVVLAGCAPANALTDTTDTDTDTDTPRLAAPDTYTWRVEILDIPAIAVTPIDLNNHRDVLGTRYIERGDAIDRDAFVLHADGLYTFDALSGSFVLPTHINDARQVVGTAVGEDGSDGGGFRIDIDDTLNWVDFAPNAQPVDLDAGGRMLVHVRGTRTTVVLWDGPGSDPIPLALGGAPAINGARLADNGTVVGAILRDNVPVPARWITPDRVEELPCPSGSGFAFAVAPSGSPILGTDDGDFPRIAVVWRDGLLSDELPALGEPDFGTLNDTGWILYHRDGLVFERRLYALADLLDLSAYEHVDPVAMNDEGVILAQADAGDAGPIAILLVPE